MSLCTPAYVVLKIRRLSRVVIVGLDGDGQDIAFVVADSTETAATTPTHGAIFLTAFESDAL